MHGITIGDGELLDDGRMRRTVTTADHLVGPPDIVQGGVAAGLCLVAARAADEVGAPVGTIDARLHRPTPVATPLVTTSTRAGAGRHEVEVAAGGEVTVTGTVAMLGHDPAPRVPDLVALAEGELPSPQPQDQYPWCWVCGPGNEHGLGLHPAYARRDVVRQGWWPPEQVESQQQPGTVDPVAIAAVLDCPTVWAATYHLETGGWAGYLMGGMRVQFFADVPLGEPYRIVAVPDSLDGRKVRARSALVAEEGGVMAVASVFQVAVTTLPGQ